MSKFDSIFFYIIEFNIVKFFSIFIMEYNKKEYHLSFKD